jgi:DNA repair and recombination protein RAD54B
VCSFFTCSSDLGSLPDFKQRISGPIVRASEPDASEWDREEGDAASQRLRELMGRLMLRRTQADILSKSLPPRTDYVVYCRLTQWQQAEYDATVTRINGYILSTI